jgi:hypothetical protein
VKLTKRGEIVLFITVMMLTIVTLLGIYKLAISIHFTGTGYCWGSFIECYGEEGEGKK